MLQRGLAPQLSPTTRAFCNVLHQLGASPCHSLALLQSLGCLHGAPAARAVFDPAAIQLAAASLPSAILGRVFGTPLWIFVRMASALRAFRSTELARRAPSGSGRGRGPGGGGGGDEGSSVPAGDDLRPASPAVDPATEPGTGSGIRSSAPSGPGADAPESERQGRLNRRCPGRSRGRPRAREVAAQAPPWLSHLPPGECPSGRAAGPRTYARSRPAHPLPERDSTPMAGNPGRAPAALPSTAGRRRWVNSKSSTQATRATRSKFSRTTSRGRGKLPSASSPGPPRASTCASPHHNRRGLLGQKGAGGQAAPAPQGSHQ